MTRIPPSKSSSSPTEPAAPAPPDETAVEPARSYAGAFAKGCGCLLITSVLGVGVALVGHGEVESWGSALVGVLFLVLIMGSSGLTGWWNK